MNDYSAALQSHQRASAICLQLFGEDHVSTANSYKQLGVTQYNMHNYSAALQSLQRELAISLKLFGEDHESTADSYRNLGVTQYIMHDYSAALQSHQRALTIRLKLFGEDHESTADSYRQLGVTQTRAKLALAEVTSSTFCTFCGKEHEASHGDGLLRGTVGNDCT